MKTDDLIERLGREATAVAPLPAPGARTAMWLLWAALYLVVVAVMMRVRMSASGATLTPLYLVQQGAALATGITAARAAFVSVIPGAPRRARIGVWIGAAVWVASLLWQMAGNLQGAGTIGLAGRTDWPCVASMTLGGLVIGAPLWWMLRNGAPLTPRATGFLIGLAALSVANIEACLTRPHAFAMTVLLWHGMTIVVAAVAVAGTANRWLRWPSLRV